MSALEIKIAIYGIVALVLLGASAWLGYHFTAAHYERVIASDKAAQAIALQDAQQQVIVAQQAQATATQQAQKDHEALVTADIQSRAAILGSVRNLETALHLGTVSSAMDHPGQPGAASTSPGGSDELARLVERLNSSIAKATAACQHDSAELAAILEIAPK